MEVPTENISKTRDLTNQRVLEIAGQAPFLMQKNQSLLHAALQARVHIYHACGGKAECTTCRVFVIEGEENLAAPNRIEELARVKMKLPDNVRLACQAKVDKGNVKVSRIIRDDMDAIFYSAAGLAKSSELQELGREKNLALFFVDIKDFTPFIESQLPFDVAHILRRLFQLFYGAVEAHHGRVIETTGDGFYAVFGLDDNSTDAASNALRSGRMISNDLLMENAHYFLPYFSHSFEIGIGLHCGKAIVGSLRAGIDTSLSVIGHNVNIASRLQDATRKLNNNFIISADAYRLADIPSVDPSRKIKLKGVKNEIEVYLIGKPFS